MLLLFSLGVQGRCASARTFPARFVCNCPPASKKCFFQLHLTNKRGLCIRCIKKGAAG